MILTIRTDSPDTEIGLFDDAHQKLDYFTWHADRTLAKTLLKQIVDRLEKVGADIHQVSGLVVFEGPGSFTGLRIGISTANAIAYGNEVPVVGSRDHNWIESGLQRLKRGDNDKIVTPFYGSEANITLPKK